MKIAILDIATLGDDLCFDSVHALGDVEIYDLTRLEEVVDRISDAEVLILNKVKLNSSNLPYAKKLKLICITATGFDNVDLDYCKAHGIAVCNVAGYSTDSVVQLTISMAFSLATNLLAFDGYVKSGTYTKSGIFNCLKPVFREISTLTWGVIGLGNIGKKVADIAKTMGCRVLVYRRSQDPDYETVDLDTLLQQSDVVSVHLPLNDKTRGLISREKIALMKKNAIFVNVARGAVTDEAALAEAVENEQIGGLAVDVYAVEPLLEDHPYQRLMDKTNVIFTPHCAWSAKEARDRCVRIVAENIAAFFSGKAQNRCC